MLHKVRSPTTGERLIGDLQYCYRNREKVMREVARRVNTEPLSVFAYLGLSGGIAFGLDFVAQKISDAGHPYSAMILEAIGVLPVFYLLVKGFFGVPKRD